MIRTADRKSRNAPSPVAMRSVSGHFSQSCHRLLNGMIKICITADSNGRGTIQSDGDLARQGIA